MATYELDLVTNGTSYDYVQTVNLEGSIYVLRMLYNERRECWTIYLYTEAGEALIEGQTMVFGINLLRRCSSPNKPPGNLLAMSRTVDQSTPGLSDVGPGQRVGLYYVESV